MKARALIRASGLDPERATLEDMDKADKWMTCSNCTGKGRSEKGGYEVFDWIRTVCIFTSILILKSLQLTRRILFVALAYGRREAPRSRRTLQVDGPSYRRISHRSVGHTSSRSLWRGGGSLVRASHTNVPWIHVTERSTRSTRSESIS